MQLNYIRNITTKMKISDNLFILRILDEKRMLNIEQEMNIYHLVNQICLLKIKGDIVELGCNDGRTAAIIQKTLNENNCGKKIYVYDSFDGLPNKSSKDGRTKFQKGWCRRSKQDLINVFKKHNIKIPIIVSGWFRETLPYKLPKKIAFAHLDGDFYSSIKESLEAIYPRLSKGAIVVIDDYYDRKIHKNIEKYVNRNKYSIISNRKIKINNDLSGVRKACDEFFVDKDEELKILISGEEKHVYFRKK